MVTKSYIRLIILSVFIFFNYKLIYSMNNLNLEISLEKAHNLFKENSLLIIDVRTEKEWKMTGIIPNSILISMHDNNNLERKDFVEELKKELSLNQNKSIAFICASGARSKIVTDFLISHGYKNIFHIPNGILGKQNDGWLFQGYPIIDFNESKETK